MIMAITMIIKIMYKYVDESRKFALFAGDTTVADGRLNLRVTVLFLSRIQLL